MKRFLFLIVAIPMLLASMVGHSQIGSPLLMPLKAGDTAVNAGTAAKVFSASGNYTGAVIQVKVTKISGTVAGTVKVQACLDGTNWEDVSGATYTPTDVATQFKTFYITAPLAYNLRVLETGTGTMSAVLTVRYYFVKY